MPNLPVSAKGSPLPAFTRRGLLTATASMAASTLMPPAGQATQPDAELTALGRRFEQAIAAHEAAQRHFNDCERRYLDECPDIPHALTHEGALGHLIRDWDYWRARELRALLRDADRQHDWEAAQAMLPVALSHERRERRVRRKLHLREAARQHEAAIEAGQKACAAILNAPSRSLASIAMKARAVKRWAAPEWWSAEPSHAELSERLPAQVLDWVIAMDDH